MITEYCTTTRENKTNAADRYRTFLGCFFLECILSNFIWQDTAWWIGSAGETDWQQILADGEQRERFWGQVLILRGIPWIVLQILPLHFLGTVGVRRLVWMAGGVRRYGDRCILEQKRTGRYRTGSGILFSADTCL